MKAKLTISVDEHVVSQTKRYAQRHGTSLSGLIERALRQGWPIPQRRRQKITERQCDIAEDPQSSPREATSAARCLAMMSSENAAIALKLLDKVVPDQHEIGGSVEHRVGLQTLLEDPDYVRYLRDRTVNQDCDAGAVCQIRESGNGAAVENGAPHGDPGQGTNGHRNGSE